MHYDAGSGMYKPFERDVLKQWAIEVYGNRTLSKNSNKEKVLIKQ